MSTMMPTSSPAMNAAARARPSKKEWIARPMKAESDVMSCSVSSQASSFIRYFFTRKSAANSRRNPQSMAMAMVSSETPLSQLLSRASGSSSGCVRSVGAA